MLKLWTREKVWSWLASLDVVSVSDEVWMKSHMILRLNSTGWLESLSDWLQIENISALCGCSLFAPKLYKLFFDSSKSGREKYQSYVRRWHATHT